jgi:RNA polymerase sigma-70 factor (ECF subfamily)
MNSDNKESVFDKKKFDGYFRKYYQALSYFAFKYLNDKDLAEDVVQNVFLNIIKDKLVFENENHRKQYLYKSVKNACLNEIRRLNTHADVIDAIKSDDSDFIELQEDSDFFHTVIRAEVYREILDAINSLPKECRRIFQMAYMDNLDNPEISRILSISINTVKVQKNNAKKRLRLLLKDLYPLVFFII